MIGLKEIPSLAELRQAYETLLHATAATESQLVRWSQWSRLDPRLAEILVSYLARHWPRLHPLTLNHELKRQPWPAAFGVLLEQVDEFLPPSRERRPLFLSWSRCALAGVQPVASQQFFVGHRKIAGREMKQDASLALSAYRKWGFLGREILVNKARVGARTLIPRETRLAALRHLARRKTRFTVRDYVNHVEGLVSLRQAEHDMKSCRWLKAHGQTKARTYYPRPPRLK